jgi:glycerol uptake facilitator-like aquaporin
MAQRRKTTISEWMGVALFCIGGLGTVSFTELASQRGDLFDPFAIAFLPICLLGAAITVISNRRANRNPS